MARLTPDEEKALKALKRKQEAPDEPTIGKSLNITVDLGDEKQVERAQKLGLLSMFASDDTDTDDDDTDTDDDDTDTDDTPRRKGFFRE